jgi:inner membrane protein
MDSLTHIALGASIAGTMLGRAHGRKAYVAGAILATLPDLDVFIHYGDPVTAMVSHRGFSHSLLTLTVLAALLAWLFRRWRPSALSRGAWLFATIWITLVTHPLLDAFTSYGTQLFWPWRPVPADWSSLFIIDPFFTLPPLVALAAGLIAGATPRSLRIAHWALALCVAYLALSVAAKTAMEHRVRDQLRHQGVVVQNMFSTPEPFSILLWRVLARTPDDHVIEAVTGVLDTRPAETLRQPLGTALLRGLPDIPALDALRWQTGDWVRYDAVGNQLIATDLRMGLAAGLYSFRFVVAQRDNGGHWQAVPPRRRRSSHGWASLPVVLRRIWREDPPLPLARWAEWMREPGLTRPQP